MNAVCELDHLVVAAASLEEGAAWCERTLGIAPGPGGRHPLMGTHNRLLALGGDAFPASYLEIIAIDPDAAAPGRVRWFGLDEPALRAALAASGPRLVHAVVRTADLDALRAQWLAAGIDAGEPLAASRDTAHGRLAWRIGVRPDGRTLLGGAWPSAIEWQGRHPTASMPASGLVLDSLVLGGVALALQPVLGLRAGFATEPSAPALAATLRTPRGPVTLTSAPTAG